MSQTYWASYQLLFGCLHLSPSLWENNMIRKQQKRSSTDKGTDLLNGNEICFVSVLLQFTPRDTFVSSTSFTCSRIYYVAVKTRKHLESKWVALLLLWSFPFILSLRRSRCVLVALVTPTATESWNSHVRSSNLALSDLIWQAPGEHKRRRQIHDNKDE
jgi:hypothetical protein